MSKLHTVHSRVSQFSGKQSSIGFYLIFLSFSFLFLSPWPWQVRVTSQQKRQVHEWVNGATIISDMSVQQLTAGQRGVDDVDIFRQQRLKTKRWGKKIWLLVNLGFFNFVEYGKCRNMRQNKTKKNAEWETALSNTRKWNRGYSLVWRHDYGSLVKRIIQ